MNIESSDSPTGRFGGCWEGLDRAGDHLTSFGVVSCGYLDSKPHSFDFDVHDDGRDACPCAISPIPPELSLLRSELLYQLRAGLDNCIYQIDILDAGGLDLSPKAGSLQFPNCSTLGRGLIRRVSTPVSPENTG